jgi:hypothetical protein
MQTLSNDQLRSSAPSVFAASPWHGVSERYRFLPTSEALAIMRDQGFHPVSVKQSRSRIEGKGDFSRHMVRLRHTDHLAANGDEEVPEVVVMNSHDKTSAYRLYAGIFRTICENGLVVQSANFGSFSLRHSGNRDLRQQVIDTTFEIVSSVPAIMGTIGDWKQIALSPSQQHAFAEAALELRDNCNVTPDQLLAPRRSEDDKPDLWHVMNRVQEGLTKGGIQGRAASGRRVTTRPIKSVSEDVRTNKALWLLAEKMAELLS